MSTRMLGKVFFSRCLLMFALGLCFSLPALASVEATVVVEKAIIWADVKRSAPLGYVLKDKKVTVGEVPRNKNQVVPIAVSGRIGYISLDDISFDNKSVPTEREYTRFKEMTEKRDGAVYSFTMTGLNATESKDTAASRPGDNWNFLGGTIKGDVPTPTSRVGVVVALDYLYAQNRPETFRMVGVSLGLSWHIIKSRWFILKVEGMGTAIPYAQYESNPLFTLNGYGFGGMAQGVANIFFGEHWALEGSAGPQLIRLYGIDRPEPFKDFDPQFTGLRWSVGLAYRL